jgi:hypothetical protein
MKKILIFALTLILLLSACASELEPDLAEETFQFTAEILNISDTSVLVATDDEDMLRSGDQYSFSCKNLPDIGAEVGDTVLINYTGGIMETAPAQINVVYWELVSHGEVSVDTEIDTSEGDLPENSDDTSEASPSNNSESSIQVYVPSIDDGIYIDYPSDDIKLIRVNGNFYMNYQDEKSEITVTCGIMDGKITSSVDSDTIPTEDNQSNFGSDYGFQRAPDGTILLDADNTWLLFRPCDVLETVTTVIVD